MTIPSDILAATMGGTVEKPLSVKTVNALLAQLLEGVLPASFHISGEISNFRTYDRGHAFFTLKEAGAELPCLMWKDALARLKFKPKDGLAVIARGAIKLYEPQGKVQLYVENLIPQGAGSLELAFRQLCDKLKAEGLFEQARKRPIIQLPRRIVIITSRTGDVLHDVLTTAHRRYPGLHVQLFPVRVQGDAAAGEIIQAIEAINAHQTKIDLILLVRGGGSLEDLWAFNDEALARAIVASKIPIATGIGHEPDITIADLVGDLRGPTPTGVTELTIPDVRTLTAAIDSHAALLTRDIRRLATDNKSDLLHLQTRTDAAIRTTLRKRSARLDQLQKQIERIEPKHAIAQGWRRVEDAQRRLTAALQKRFSAQLSTMQRLEHRMDRASPLTAITRHKARLAALENHLRAISPQSVLDRGFSITTTEGGQILRSAQQVKKGDIIKTKLADGSLDSTVGKPKQSSLF